MTEDQVGRPGGEPVPPSGPELDQEASWGEEQAVRALLHRAVADVRPAPDALARIRRAVPARRARYRQAWTGAAVIVALSAVALPTLSGLGALQLSDGAAAGASTQAGTEAARPGGGAVQRSSGPGAPLPAPGGTAGTGVAGASPSATGPSGPAAPTVLPVPSGLDQPNHTIPPSCARTDLGAGSVTTGPADAATGRVYGSFTVTNVSTHPCLLTDTGTITGVLSAGGTVQVVPHTAGDPAPDLPPPGPDVARVLTPGAGYRVVFAWVPDAVCPNTGPAPQSTGNGQSGATPTAPPTSGAVGGAQPGGAQPALASPGTGSDGGVSPGVTAAPSGPPPSSPPASPAAPGGLTLAYRPLGTAPDAVAASIGGVCGGGTVYRAPLQ